MKYLLGLQENTLTDKKYIEAYGIIGFRFLKTVFFREITFGTNFDFTYVNIVVCLRIYWHQARILSVF